ncbi:MAG TPA: biotin--[acetyl-CoA-carboxylase] ligase [Actinomycetota bacterium]|nr:biotin--[acetyl-CoA-carboxylase] ligase [Actinomycetota bacterium]
MPADDLSPDALREALRGSFGRELQVHDAIGSTNDATLEWAADGAPEGAVVTADQQTQGRGRWNRSWSSPPGRSISLSLVLRPGSREQAGLVTTLVGVAAADAIEAAAGIRCGIKWPNDVVAPGGKVAGILVESRSSGAEMGFLVAGIGVNVSWSPEEMPPEIRAGASSLVAEGAGPLPRYAVIAELLDAIERWYGRAGTASGRAEVVEAATVRSTILGRAVLLRGPDGTLTEARAVALAEDGALEVEVDGARRSVTAGEVERIRTED